MSKKSTKLEGLQDTFKEHDISADTIELSDALIKKLKKSHIRCRIIDIRPIRDIYWGISS